MAEEEVVAAAAAEEEATTSPAPVDLKRKHHELEPQPDVNGKESDSVARTDDENKEEEEEEAIDAKRPRLDDEEQVKPQDLVISENGLQELKEKELLGEEKEPSEEKNIEATEEAPNGVHSEQPSTEDQLAVDLQPHLKESPQNENQKPSEAELLEPCAEVSQQVDAPASESESISRKIDVPNNKVGVLIGKGGETIRSLQFNSGAKIQIMRDADVDPQSTNRPLELVGSLESINKAEKLIRDVIAEADAGGSPALVARGFSTALAAGAGEEVLIQVPNEKVGVIIGKGGETIKNLQTRSGARIQLIPQHLPDGDQSKERTVRVSGDKKQIERARDMIKDVMNQPPRRSSSGGGFNQQSFRPRGPSSQQQWGSRGPNSAQPRGYNYQQRGPYPSQNSQYPPHGYGNYPPHAGPRSNYGSGWEQRPPSMQGPPHQGGGGYDYYGGQGQMTAAPLSGPHSNSRPAHGPGQNLSNVGPPSQGNYNYVQPHGQPGTYPAQGFGESKYENQGPGQHIYSGSQTQGSHPGFAPHDQYGKAPPSYGVPPNGPPAQNYSQPRASQPGNMPYQGGPTQQPHGQNAAPPQQTHGQNAAPPQQTYPYAASGPVPPTYSWYGPSSEGYNQAQPGAGSAQIYAQQQGPGYAQVGGYGSYPAPQQGYGDQSAQNNAGYGSYPGGADPAAYGSSTYGAPQTGQSGFPQPVPGQPGYDQSAPHTTGYGGVPAGVVPAGDGKSVPPQPGYGQPVYDATQMYGAAPR